MIPELYITRIGANAAGIMATGLGLGAGFNVTHARVMNEQGFVVELFDASGSSLGFLGEDWQAQQKHRALAKPVMVEA